MRRYAGAYGRGTRGVREGYGGFITSQRRNGESFPERARSPQTSEAGCGDHHEIGAHPRSRRGVVNNAVYCLLPSTGPETHKVVYNSILRRSPDLHYIHPLSSPSLRSVSLIVVEPSSFFSLHSEIYQA